MVYSSLVCCTFLAGILLSAGCEKEPVQARFNLSVKTNKGDPVFGAKVNVGEDLLGKTDTLGRLNAALNLEPDQAVVVKVTKNSSDYYFAPYSKEFFIESAATQSFSIDATLFVAPKPVNDVAKTSNEIKQVANNSNEMLDAAGSAVNHAPAVDNRSAAIDEKKLKEPFYQEFESEDLTETTQKVDGEIDLALGTSESNASSNGVTEARSDEKPEIKEVQKTEIVSTEIKAGAQAGTDLENKLKSPDKKSLSIVTFHTFSNNIPVEGVTVTYTPDKSAKQIKACTTNGRGRCILRVATPEKKLHFEARKIGFLTSNQSKVLAGKNIVKFELDPGISIDVFTKTSSYGFEKPLGGVTVSVEGKKVGVTANNGRFTYRFSGDKNDLISVQLEKAGFLPPKYSTDFIVSGPLVLEKSFPRIKPANPKVTILPVNLTGGGDEQSLAEDLSNYEMKILPLLKSKLYRNGVFTKYPFSRLEKMISENGLTTQVVKRRGWKNHQAEFVASHLAQPTIVRDDDGNNLEISLINSDGKMVASVNEPIDLKGAETTLSSVVDRLVSSLQNKFPFEAAITSANKKHITINIGRSSGLKMARDNRVRIFGTSRDQIGKVQAFEEIGVAAIERVEDHQTIAKVVQLRPRASIALGDMVKLEPRYVERNSNFVKVFVFDQADRNKRVFHANVYLNNSWIGSTESEGAVNLPNELLVQNSKLKVIKSGFKIFTKKINNLNIKRLDIGIVRLHGQVRIESKPSGAKVYIENKLVGRTPLNAPVQVPSGFVSVKVVGDRFYKPFERVFELDEGTLELAGSNEIELEIDHLAQVERLYEARKFRQAATKLNEVPESHSDYLEAQSRLGEIYLVDLKEPLKAAEAFHRVTSDTKVAAFVDKRFVGTHVNEGLALYSIGENYQDKNPDLAQAHLVKALEVFQRVEPFLRFVSKSEYSKAAHNLQFYSALAKQQLWKLTGQRQFLSQAKRSWMNYLNVTVKEVPLPNTSQNLVKFARYHLKDAEAYLRLKPKD